MTPRALHNLHLAAPDALPILRPKLANLPPPDFKAQTGKLVSSDVNACSISGQVSRHLQDLSRSRRTGNPLELAIASFLDLADAVFITLLFYSVHHVHHHVLCSDSLSPPIQAYSRLPFTDLGVSAWNIFFIFTTCHGPPRRILHLHNMSQGIHIHQNYTTLSITYHPRVTTIGP